MWQKEPLCSFEAIFEAVLTHLSRPAFHSAQQQQLHDQMLRNCTRRLPDAMKYVREVIRIFLQERRLHLEGISDSDLVTELYQEMYGFSVIEPLLDDPTIQEITVNGPKNIWIEQDGLKRRTELVFRDELSLRRVIDRCMGYTKKEINRQEAAGQTTMADGSRIFIAIPPVGKELYLNYRKFTVFNPTEKNYLQTNTFTAEALEVLKLFPAYRVNLLIIGGQNTGKTTLLSFLTDYYPPDSRIGVLESPEFETHIDQRRPQGNVFMLKADQNTNVSLLDVFKHALRFSADVLVVPEARGAEMEEVIKVSRRGSGGTISTIHSLGPETVIDDISFMFMETGKNYQPHLLKRMIAKSLDIVLTTYRFADGSRRLVRISEVDWDDDEKEEIIIRDLFRYQAGALRRTTESLSKELAESMCFHGANEEMLRGLGLMPK